MRFVAALLLIGFAAAAVAKVAVDKGATGVENGVLWLIGLGAFLLCVCVVFAAVERLLGGGA